MITEWTSTERTFFLWIWKLILLAADVTAWEKMRTYDSVETTRKKKISHLKYWKAHDKSVENERNWEKMNAFFDKFIWIIRCEIEWFIRKYAKKARLHSTRRERNSTERCELFIFIVEVTLNFVNIYTPAWHFSYNLSVIEHSQVTTF